jgi:Ser/Thr protein kinase RdoA (MazF antagonist)
MQLFQPNNLSLLKPEFTSLNDSVLNAELEAMLRQSYSISDWSPLRVSQPVGANIASQNLVVEIGPDRYFVKRRNVSDQKRLHREAKLGFELAALGAKVPRVILTREGDYIHVDQRWCCVLFWFEDGSYYSGRGRELHSAAESYGALTLAAQKLFEIDSGNSQTDDAQFLDELEGLMDEARSSSEATVARLASEHREEVLKQLGDVRTAWRTIQSPALALHLDYHPLNILIRDGEVSCILDLEHLKVYPVVAGVGFAGYKLIRQAMVHEDVRLLEFSNPSLLTRWLEGWRKSFPNLPLSPREIGMGARYQVLFLIHLILDTFLRRGDDRFVYDLEKQIGSLYEINTIVTRY